MSVSLHPVGQLYVNVHERPGTAADTGIARQTQNKEPLLSGVAKRHELGRLDIQETNKAPSTDKHLKSTTTTKKKPCREREKERSLKLSAALWFPSFLLETLTSSLLTRNVRIKTVGFLMADIKRNYFYCSTTTKVMEGVFPPAERWPVTAAVRTLR